MKIPQLKIGSNRVDDFRQEYFNDFVFILWLIGGAFLAKIMGSFEFAIYWYGIGFVVLSIFLPGTGGEGSDGTGFG